MNASVTVSVEIDGLTLDAGQSDMVVGAGGRVTSTFRHEAIYLADTTAYQLDPALHLDLAPHAVGGLPGAFRDTTPDHWGRRLISRRLVRAAHDDGAPAPQITEIDYLLGVSDYTRQGAIRFRRHGDAAFVARDGEVPHLVELSTLLAAADAVQENEDESAIRILLDAGTGSLGGARPKASVRDGDRLSMAKFPSAIDEWDVIAWEAVTLDLAALAGIDIPEYRLLSIAGRSVLLLARFDRTPDGERVGYLSASSLIEAEESVGGDYAFIGEALAEQDSADLPALLRELWRRVAFSVAVHNTDDHVKNHGFLRSRQGWHLSPAFDINPNPDAGAARATSISGADLPAHEAHGLRDLADDFGISRSESIAILAQVVAAVSGWREVARLRGLNDQAVDRMAAAFDPGRDRLIQMLDVSPGGIGPPQRQQRRPKGSGGGRFTSNRANHDPYYC